MAVSTTPAGPTTFFDEVEAATPGQSHLELCLQCGTCGGSCPSGPDMDHTPRALFALIQAGLKEDVLRSNTPWYCVSCYYCTVRCPQQIRITDLMYTLKRMAIREGYYQESSASAAPDFSDYFIDMVENFGRSFEMGLATRYYLRHNPLGLVKMATTMGPGMFFKGRMGIIPTRIKNLGQLKAILNKAKEVGGGL